MLVDPVRLRRALEDLGALLDATGDTVELAIIGGGAMLLSGVHVRPTEDIDVVAQRDGSWQPASPLPGDVIAFVRDIGRTYDLPVKRAGTGVDWLNASASFLMPDDLPPGFFDRTTAHRFGGLTLHVPHTSDLIVLKVLAATRPERGADRQKDIQDLVKLAPTEDELADALRWALARRPSTPSTASEQMLEDLAAAGVAVETARGWLRDGGRR